MITRSPSRRRRASRSGGSSPQPVRSNRLPPSPAVSPGRRASIAVSPVDSERIQRHMLAPDMMNRSPRHSIIPDISLDSRSNSSAEDIDIPMARQHSPRNSLVPDAARSPRHSLVPGDYSRSPRHSLVPESALSPRNSLVPDTHYNRSPRNSLVPEISKSPRHSLVPDQPSINRSSRHSLVPDANGSRLNLDFNRSPRNSILPDGSREARNPRINGDNYEAESPDDMQTMNRSPRHSIAPDVNRSPRGSIAVDRDRTSPRGSIGGEYTDRSPRGSIGDTRNNRDPMNHISRIRSNDMLDKNEKSPRGSLTLTFQDPPVKNARRYSTDYGRSVSPYRSSRGNLNQGYNQSQTTYYESGSRRASSSVSQVSGDDQKRLFSDKNYNDGEPSLGMGLTLTTYGSVAYQLKDANLEANDTCDFIIKAIKIFNKTAVVTVFLVCLAALPVVMLIMGAQFLRDCPREPYIPIYMVVGGTVASLKMAWVLWDHLHTRRPPASRTSESSNIGARLLSCALTIFLIVWFVLGNNWILRIKWPDYVPTLFEPNKWCHRTLYAFAIVHLMIVYGIVAVIILLVIFLAGCQAFGCSWLGPTSVYE